MSTIRTFARTSLGAALVGAALLPLLAAPTAGAAAPAAAPVDAARSSVAVSRDARHDVVRSGPSGDRAAPTRRQGDIVGIHVRHGADAVTIRVRFAALTRPTRSASMFIPLVVRTPGSQFVTGLTADRLTPQGVTWIEEQGDVDCPGLTSRIRYGRDVAVLRVPRTCLGDPAWVRVGGSALTSGAGTTTYVDSAPGRTLASDRVGPRAWHPGS